MPTFRTAAVAFSLLFSHVTLAAHMAHGTPPVTVAIVLFDGVQIIDFAAPYEVFGQARFGVYTVSADGKPVTTAMGLKVTPDHAFADAPDADVLLVPGGDVDVAAQDAAVLDFVRSRSAGAAHTLSVCTGAYILAAAGLLDGAHATTFHNAFDGLAQKYPKITVVRDARWVDAGKVTTSAGLSSGIDAALHVVAQLRGEEFARSTAMHLEYDWKPEGGFVRGRMADHLLPQLGNVAWPDGVQFDRVLSLGDASAWHVRYRITGASDGADLLARIDTGMAGIDGWSAVPSLPHAWRATREGKTRTLVFAIDAVDGALQLDITLATAA